MNFTEEQMKSMVDRFLSWRLPATVRPDCSWPVQPYNSGTNLLTATEARQMLEHVLAEPGSADNAVQQPDEKEVPAVSALPQGWQKIEKAPKDGTRILAYCPEYGIRETRRGIYTQGSPGYAKWQRGEGPPDYGWDWIEEKHNAAHTWNPTHWQALPPPPVDQGEQQ